MPSPATLREAVAALTDLAARQLDLSLPNLAGKAAAKPAGVAAGAAAGAVSPAPVAPVAAPVAKVATEEAVEYAVPEVIETYGGASSMVGADWYDRTREELGIGGSFQAVPAEAGVRPGTGGGKELAEWVNRYLQQPGADPAVARQMLNGGVQRRITNAARYTVSDSSIMDPRAAGWYRHTRSDACEFCRTLAHEAVYSDRSAKFGAHDHCSCMAAPAFKGVEPHVPRPPTRDLTDAERDRARAWIAANIH